MIRSLNKKTPQIHPKAFVSEAAYIVGDVQIDEGASIWPGTVIRADSGYIKIGKNTCIQDNSVLHGDDNVIIGENSTIASGSIISSSLSNNTVVKTKSNLKKVQKGGG